MSWIGVAGRGGLVAGPAGLVLSLVMWAPMAAAGSTALSGASTASTPAPSATTCNQKAITGDLPGTGPNATVPGQGVENGSRIHNTTSQALDVRLNVQVSLTPAGSSWQPTGPTVAWDIDGGPWQPIKVTYYPPSQPGNSPEWNSDVVAGFSMAPQSSHLVRLWMSFASNSSSGTYDGWFVFGDADCPLIGGSSIMPFVYRPDYLKVQPTGAATGAHPAITHPSPTPSPPPSPSPSPSRSASPPPPPLPSAPPSLAAASSGSHAGTVARAIGIGVAGFAGGWALVQAVRWRRVRPGG